MIHINLDLLTQVLMNYLGSASFFSSELIGYKKLASGFDSLREESNHYKLQRGDQVGRHYKSDTWRREATTTAKSEKQPISRAGVAPPNPSLLLQLITTGHSRPLSRVTGRESTNMCAHFHWSFTIQRMC